MGEQRSKFMGARQAYFGYALANTALTAYNRAVRLGLVRGRERALSDIRVEMPDIDSQDNANLSLAASQMAGALATVKTMGISGDTFKTLTLRTVLQFAGMNVADDDLDTILAESEGGDEETDDGQAFPVMPQEELEALQAVAQEYQRAGLLLARSRSNGHG
jgi:hypothetical protein